MTAPSIAENVKAAFGEDATVTRTWSLAGAQYYADAPDGTIYAGPYASAHELGEVAARLVR